ncbi:DegT/DnrJ/EryC1/StrS family aminotransferase, partial [Acidobacteria bacterium AH-259-D05]|nr:DegT/DnrJ/EryC1/StrS family aminotransferase [Acidobacteria bacterium AH-259-D05]
MKVPFADLAAQHQEIRGEIDALIGEIIDKSSFIGGPHVKTFEESFADYCGTRFAVACASGTDALKLGLMAAGVGREEEVITVPHTFIATIEAITSVGSHPVFVDIERDSYHISPDRLEEFLEGECRVQEDGRLVNRNSNRPVVAVLPVHLYGLVVDMERILALADRFNLSVIEDAAQAHGALCILDEEEKKAGTFGAVGAFSFYPGKNLGAMGDGGAVVTDDPEKDRSMRVWRDHGQSEKYIYVSPRGWNIRLDALKCAVLTVKLQRLEGWNERRRQAAQWYRDRLQRDSRIVLPVEPAGRKHVYHVFVVRLADRYKVKEELSKRGIETGLHYPISLHLQKAYRHLGYEPGDFPEAEAAAESILSLPMFPHITEEQVDYVCG